MNESQENQELNQPPGNFPGTAQLGFSGLLGPVPQAPVLHPSTLMAILDTQVGPLKLWQVLVILGSIGVTWGLVKG